MVGKDVICFAACCVAVCQVGKRCKMQGRYLAEVLRCLVIIEEMSGASKLINAHRLASPTWVG